jgi:hypothetical protein
VTALSATHANLAAQVLRRAGLQNCSDIQKLGRRHDLHRFDFEFPYKHPEFSGCKFVATLALWQFVPCFRAG